MRSFERGPWRSAFGRLAVGFACAAVSAAPRAPADEPAHREPAVVAPRTAPVRLTHDGRLKMHPRFLAGGEELVYTVVEGPTLTSLMRLNLAEGASRRLHPDASTSQFQAVFSADGRYCAFVEQRGVTNVKLVIRDRAGGEDAVYDPGGGRAHLGWPTIAPDASRVAFCLPISGGQQIVSVDIKAADRRELTETSGVNNWPAFSPDGRQIAFGSSRDGDFEIYLMQSDGSDVRRLTRSPGRDMRPAWSPDGQRIAFVSARDGNYEIYVMQADASNLRRVTNHPERDDYPVWHPDGGRLAVVSERQGQFDVYLINAPN